MINTVAKWLKLRRIAEGIVNKPLDIHISTEFDDTLNLRSYVVFNEVRVDIFLNAKYAKDVESVIESVAHELSHVFVGSGNHDEIFTKNVKDIHKTLTDKMRS